MDTLERIYRKVKSVTEEYTTGSRIILIAWVTAGIILTSISAISILLSVLKGILSSKPETLLIFILAVLIVIGIPITIMAFRKKSESDNTDNSEDSEDSEDTEESREDEEIFDFPDDSDFPEYEIPHEMPEDF